MDRCEKCAGFMHMERTIDYVAGVTGLEWKCVNCGKRLPIPDRLIPLAESRR
jgi:hypothetical protein